MASMNKVFLMGNIVADPELRETKAAPVANFTIAVNEGKEAGFFQCECWGNWALNLTRSAVKGSLVIVEGKLIQQKWFDEADQMRSRVKVRASRVFHVASQYKKEHGNEETKL